jgi:hypothetical protein
MDQRAADERMARMITEIVGPVVGDYIKELRWDIEKLTARMDAVEAENAALRAKIARGRPVANMSDRIARIERQMDEVDND